MEFDDVMNQLEHVDVNANGFVTRQELEDYFRSTDQDLAVVEVSWRYHFKIQWLKCPKLSQESGKALDVVLLFGKMIGLEIV